MEPSLPGVIDRYWCCTHYYGSQSLEMELMMHYFTASCFPSLFQQPIRCSSACSLSRLYARVSDRLNVTPESYSCFLEASLIAISQSLSLAQITKHPAQWLINKSAFDHKIQGFIELWQLGFLKPLNQDKWRIHTESSCHNSTTHRSQWPGQMRISTDVSK